MKKRTTDAAQLVRENLVLVARRGVTRGDIRLLRAALRLMTSAELRVVFTHEQKMLDVIWKTLVRRGPGR